MTQESNKPVEMLADRDVLFPILRDHWLTDLGCSHEGAGSNQAACYCGWAGNRVANVGEAVAQWAVHVSSIAGFQIGEARLSSTPTADRNAVVDRLEHLIDRDRYILAIALGHIRKALDGHRWLLEGRGPYEWDDDRYRDEFTDWLANVEASLGPLAKLAFDKSDCTTDSAKVEAAREAARHYCIEAPKGHRSMLPSDLGLPCPSCAALASTPSTAPADMRGLAGELERLPIRTEILNVDTGETGAQDVAVPLDLRDRILSALSRTPAVTDEAVGWFAGTEDADGNELVRLPEAARDLLRAMQDDQRTVGYKLDLWNRLQDCLATLSHPVPGEQPQSPTAIVDGPGGG
jgi:hypothetical protein